MSLPTYKVLRSRKYKLAAKATAAEIKFQQRLNGGRIKFEFQALVPPYIVDFLIRKRMLVIELDGLHHSVGEQRAYDERRTLYLERRGFRVVRIPNSEVMTWPLKLIRQYPKIQGNSKLIKQVTKEFQAKGLTPKPATKAKSAYVKGNQ